MKKITSLIAMMSLAMLLSFCASDEEAKKDEPAPAPAAPAAPAKAPEPAKTPGKK